MARLQEKAVTHVLLGVIILWSVGHTIIWLWIDTRPPRWDEAWYLTLGLKYQQALISDGMFAFFKAWLTLDQLRPSLVSVLVVPVYLLFGPGPDVALAVNCVAFVVLILAVYGLGARLAGPSVGLFAAFLVGTYPGVYGLARVFAYDFCDATLVAVALYLLLRSELFSRTRTSLFWGATLGLGVLCRGFFPIFVVGPLLVTMYALWRTGRQPGERRRYTGRNLSLALLVGVGVAAPWYAYNLPPMLARSFDAAYGAEAVGYGPGNPFTWSALLNYFINFINHHPTLLGLLLFVIAIGGLWKNWTMVVQNSAAQMAFPGQGVVFLASAVLVPYSFFSTLPSQDLKNIVPVTSAMAVLTAWGLMLVRATWLRRVLLTGGGVGMVVQFWLGTYGLAAFPKEIVFWKRPGMLKLFLLRQAPIEHNSFLFLPQQGDWRLTDILQRVSEGQARPNGQRIANRLPLLAIVPEHPALNFSTFRYYLTLRGFSVDMSHPGDPRIPDGREYRARILEADFALVKTENPGPDWLNVNNDAMIEFLRSPESGFVEIAPRFPLPDGSQAVLYAAKDGQP
jgi:4-amino-4-deoxy-L-arabinose transferase-like glycosyltransferase